MLILGIESATPQVGCAVGGHEGVLASAHSSRGKRHAEMLTPQIDFVRKQARIELSEISVVAVDIGPGLFTGLRVGISAAMATAFALGVPMIGVSSLDLLAFPVRHSPRLIVAAIDARRGEVFHAFYRQVPGGVQRITEPAVANPEDLSSELLARGEECLLVGDGALRYADHADDRAVAHGAAIQAVLAFELLLPQPPAPGGGIDLCVDRHDRLQMALVDGHDVEAHGRSPVFHETSVASGVRR